ncbi:glutathione peroxidase [Shewanella sp. NFH-SH190041]|uniref:glutathione peroxidase n=1 Tax=Shewanella sp. NFH-SH190041 TaxID=2950245 RepID=UPI0021C36AB9|nr:glutathione peroxidase [Shewanella sp. NFH-SH190041]BDM65361.1 glutathione peroxidase [Shewanella sp. NFH-SH190041]
METLYQFEVTDIQGQQVKMADYAGKVLLIVNTASQCGFTPQYAGLEALYQEFGLQGLMVLGFPCNQFAKQEPKDNAAIASFCQLNFGVTFPLFAKIAVNGTDAAPLYRYLKHQAPGLLGSEAIKWNFTKFLVDRQGNVIKRFAPQDTPDKLRQIILTLL